MKVLNLACPEKSEIKFEPIKFPDGQQQVKIDTTDYYMMPYNYNNVLIKTRLNNFLDVELLICAVASLRGLGTQNINLYVPYFLGSRSDIKFEEGSNNYLKTVICPLINAIGFGQVTVLDAHSIALENCLNNFNGENNHEFVKQALGYIASQDGFVLMSADGGGLKKIYKLAESINYTGDIITCGKSRGVDGKITRTEVPDFDLTKDIILVDDICDGGKTFTEIAKVIRERYKKNDSKNHGKIYLIVTHGIFSKGYVDLMVYFDAVYCTNSYKHIENIEIIKQLNVF
jgi:ribose-phosphate pyrophosphokinase